jgi:hypothetical protein
LKNVNKFYNCRPFSQKCLLLKFFETRPNVFKKSQKYNNTLTKKSTIPITLFDAISKQNHVNIRAAKKPPIISCQSGQKKTLSFEDLNFFGCFEMDVASSIRGWTGL